MSKGIHLAGADDRGDNKYESAWQKGDQINHITGEKDSNPDVHCHMYNNPETGKHGVDHRGSCAVCDDKKGGNTYKSIGDSEPSGSGDSDTGSSDTGNSGGK